MKPPPPPLLLSVRQIKKSYATPQGPITVLKGVDLSLEAAKSLALMGESGSGKSTLLYLIAGLDAADEGEIVLDGVVVTALDDSGRAALRRAHVGIVFQQFNLVPSLSVSDNIAFQARLSDRFDQDWFDEIAERLGLAGLLSRYPEQLSGGQQQRVAVGRALALKPRLVLADEPTGNLDEATGDDVLSLMLDLVKRVGAGFLMVTHSARLAARLDGSISLAHGKLVAT